MSSSALIGAFFGEKCKYQPNGSFPAPRIAINSAEIAWVFIEIKAGPAIVRNKCLFACHQE